MRRMRRLRTSEAMRELVCETVLDKKDLIYPIFVTETSDEPEEIVSMPGIMRYPVDKMDDEIKRAHDLGISGILIFGIPKKKDERGSCAYDDDGITQRAIRRIKKMYPDMLVIADVCLCEYTSHGHCGVLCGCEVDNDSTLPLLCRAAVSLAKAGADIIAPSDMMDGHVAAIREALDENGFINTPIMAYSAKFASAYYSPFRDAADSAPSFGNRKTYQMDTRNAREALREIEADIEEGADFVMVKPALAYLDVLKEASMKYNIPMAAYNVSGEYSMVKAASKLGWIDEKAIVMENLQAMKRAGAKVIITYHALDAAGWLQ